MSHVLFPLIPKHLIYFLPMLIVWTIYSPVGPLDNLWLLNCICAPWVQLSATYYQTYLLPQSSLVL